MHAGSLRRPVAGIVAAFLVAGAGSCSFGQGRPDDWFVRPGLPGIADRSTGAAIEPFGAEELHDADNRPRIPEPLVFDLVRPLGALRGEAEINTLAILPLTHRTRSEWAPEIELAVRDGVALEFELPFEDSSLHAFKFAGQVTFGMALDGQFIHGAQGILLYDRRTGDYIPTLLYLAGMEFDDRWSALLMLGVRTEIGGGDPGHRTERLFNLSIFRHVSEISTIGVETNVASALNGAAELLLIPQWHREINDQCLLQLGLGGHFADESVRPVSAFRLIYSF